MNTILLAVGFVFLGWYQKYQIDILRKEIESQKNIISSLKQYSDILDINKIKEFVSVSEITIEKKKELEKNEMQKELTAKIKLMEAEKEGLAAKIGESSEVPEKLKADKEALVKRLKQRLTAFYLFRIVTVSYQLFSYLPHRLAQYAQVLCLSNNIQDDKLTAYAKQLSDLRDILNQTLDSFGEMNISPAEIEEDLKVPDILSTFNADIFNAKINKLGESMSSELDHLIADVQKSLASYKQVT